MFFSQAAIDAVSHATSSVDDVVDTTDCTTVEIMEHPDELGDDERLVASYLIDLEKAESSIPTEKLSHPLKSVKVDDEFPLLEDKSSNVSTSPKKKPNKAVTAQTLLSCSDKCYEAIKLMEGTLKKRKSFASTNKDINLSLNALKVISSNVEKAAGAHLSSYDQTVRKRMRVQEEDLYWMSNNENDSSKVQLQKSRSTCLSVLAENANKDNVIPSKKVAKKKEQLRTRFINVQKDSKV